MANHVEINRAYWNGMAEGWIAGGERLWACETPEWGIWGIPQRDLPILPGDLTGLRAIELGCGTAYVSGWMAKRGAEVTGVDVSDKQLATARRIAAEHGVDLTLLEVNAEATGLPDAAFDFAISEYGAAIWCPPEAWLTEAARLLKPGGRLAFLGNHPLTICCSPENGAALDRVLHRPYRALTGADWTEVEIDPGGVEFNLTIEGWFEVFAKTGFRVTGYKEVFAPQDATQDIFPIPAEWAKSFPNEQVWWLEKIV